MRSELHVKTNSFKLYLSVGACLTVIIIAMFVLFAQQVAVILLSVAGVIVVSGIVATWIRFDEARHHRLMRQTELAAARARVRLAEYQADAALIVDSKAGTFVLDGITPKFYPVATASREMAAQLALPSPAIDLLPLLDNAGRVLVKGASDAGKTTLLQHVASRSQDVVIVDPHFTPGVWPTGCRIVGAGRNFSEINGLLIWAENEMSSRYKQRATGQTDYKPITLIIDEFMSVAAECDRAGEILSKLIRESRKVGFRLFIGSHSELVKPLGLDGASDVRDGLLIVRLGVDQITRERHATVDYGRGERPCQFPPYIAGEQSRSVAPDLIIPADPEAVKFEEWESLLAGGMTKSDATVKIYGKKFTGEFAQELNRRLSSFS